MKSTIKILLITIFLATFYEISNAQVEDHYHTASVSVFVPIIVNHQGVMTTRNGKTEKNIPEHPIAVDFRINVKDMRVDETSFSGISIDKNDIAEDIKTFNGKVSEDKQMIEYIEVTRNYTVFSSGIWGQEENEKEVTISARFENIPIWFGQYRFEYGVTKITSMEYKEKYHRNYTGSIDTYTDNYIKINDTRITKYSTNCIMVSFKPGVLYPEQLPYVTIEGPDTVNLPDANTDPNQELTIDLIAKSDLEGNFRWETDCENIVLRPDKNNDDKVNVLISKNPWSGNHAWVKAVQTVGVAELSAVHVFQINGSKWDGEKSARVMVPSGCKDHLMKGIAALIISDLMKIPDLSVFEGVKIDKLKAEIALSQSGLVNPTTWIAPDKMMKQVDLEIFVNEVTLLPEDRKPPLESITIKIEYKYKGESLKKTFIWLYGGSVPFFDVILGISSKAQEILDLL